jgi:F420H(2)-dependent quinone reductase
MGETRQKTRHQGSMGFRVTIKIIGAVHRWLYRMSDGKLGQTFFGSPILLLTTTGRRTGQPRTWPLTYLPEGECLIVVASNGGQPNHPAWYLNLRVCPQVSVQLGDQTQTMIAHTVEGEERAWLWSRVVEEYPAYAGYQRKTDRQIPVVVLRPET